MRGMRAAFVLTMVFATGLAVGTQTPKSPDGLLMKSAVFLWEATPPRPTDKGAVRSIFRAPSVTLDELEYHITTLNPNQSPHPPHQHVNEEVIIVKEGAVEAFVNGAWTPVTTGSLIFFASNVPHTVRNVGAVAATYHVVNWKTPGGRAEGDGRPMRRGALVAAAALLTALTVSAVRGQEPVGYFEGSGDVGAPALAGSTTYDAQAQTYTIVGAGTNMWATRDEFQFVWRKLSGNFIVRTHAAFVGTGVDPHRKIGWIARKSLDADSAYVDAAVHGDGLTSLQFRKKAGAVTAQIESTLKAPDVIQLERRGGTYIMSVARFGEPFVVTETSAVDLGDDVYVGLFVCSHNPKVQERAVFSNVRIVVPPKIGWTPYRDYIGSNLEIMTVATGARTVLHTSPISIQAPNWTRMARS